MNATTVLVTSIHFFYEWIIQFYIMFGLQHLSWRTCSLFVRHNSLTIPLNLLLSLSIPLKTVWELARHTGNLLKDIWTLYGLYLCVRVFQKRKFTYYRSLFA